MFAEQPVEAPSKMEVSDETLSLHEEGDEEPSEGKP